MPLCCKQLMGFQRRFLLLFGLTLLATSLLYGASEKTIIDSTQISTWAKMLSTLPAIPFLVMILLIPRYLRQETDEFVRALVLRAVLWGFAVPMVLDTIWAFLWRLWPVEAAMGMLRVMPMLNVDLFCITALVAVTVQSRRYQ